MRDQSKAICILLQQLVLCQSIAAASTGFIRASNGHFVDEDCDDFVATGLNTWGATKIISLLFTLGNIVWKLDMETLHVATAEPIIIKSATWLRAYGSDHVSKDHDTLKYERKVDL